MQAETKTFSQVLEETGCVVYTTRGVSMRPLLRQGKDVVVIEKPKEHCKKYDTVTRKDREILLITNIRSLECDLIV